MSPRPARWRRAVVASQVVALGVLVTACNQESLVDNVSDDASPSTGAVNTQVGQSRFTTATRPSSGRVLTRPSARCSAAA